MRIEVPAWFGEVWLAWCGTDQTGQWIINWRRGHPTEIEERRKRFQPPAGAGTPICAGCGEPMTARDGGTLWVCRCGRKRTLAQVGRGLPGEGQKNG